MNEQSNLFEAPKLALNRVETAKALSVSPATLDRLANRGLIFPCRATGRPLYPITEIERFLRETSDVVSV
jgi:helix-turn-helix protein